jgi:hypothetical protein
MDRLTAKKLIAIYRRLGDVLNEADSVVRSVADDGAREQQLRALGTLMQDVWLNLEAPIVREHPALDPDKGRRNA